MSTPLLILQRVQLLDPVQTCLSRQARNKSNLFLKSHHHHIPEQISSWVSTALFSITTIFVTGIVLLLRKPNFFMNKYRKHYVITEVVIIINIGVPKHYEVGYTLIVLNTCNICTLIKFSYNLLIVNILI